jgi:hypothetical protein
MSSEDASNSVAQDLKKPKTQDSRPRPNIYTKTQDQNQTLAPRLKTKTKSSKKPRIFLVPRPKPRFFFQNFTFLAKKFFFQAGKLCKYLFPLVQLYVSCRFFILYIWLSSGICLACVHFFTWVLFNDNGKIISIIHMIW